MKFHSNSTTDREPIYEQIVLALANHEGVGATDLEPLYETIDPEALDSLFRPGIDGKIEFTYEGHEVAVHGDSTVTLDESTVDVEVNEPARLGEDTSEIGATK